jgi:hypothetical protein
LRSFPACGIRRALGGDGAIRAIQKQLQMPGKLCNIHAIARAEAAGYLRDTSLVLLHSNRKSSDPGILTLVAITTLSPHFGDLPLLEVTTVKGPNYTCRIDSKSSGGEGGLKPQTSGKPRFTSEIAAISFAIVSFQTRQNETPRSRVKSFEAQRVVKKGYPAVARITISNRGGCKNSLTLLD